MLIKKHTYSLPCAWYLVESNIYNQQCIWYALDAWVKMVGYDPDLYEMPKLAYGLAGGMSGFLTRSVSQPLDVLKIRLQVLCWLLSLSLSVYSFDRLLCFISVWTVLKIYFFCHVCVSTHSEVMKYSCKFITMKFSKRYPDDLAVKNACTICHLTLVLFLQYLTLCKNCNTALKSWSRGSLTLGNIFLRASSTKPVANMAARMCKGTGTSLRTP